MEMHTCPGPLGLWNEGMTCSVLLVATFFDASFVFFNRPKTFFKLKCGKPGSPRRIVAVVSCRLPNSSEDTALGEPVQSETFFPKYIWTPHFHLTRRSVHTCMTIAPGDTRAIRTRKGLPMRARRSGIDHEVMSTPRIGEVQDFPKKDRKSVV